MVLRAAHASRAVSLATALLALLLLDVARTALTAVAVLGGVGAAAAAVATVGLLRGNEFEARLTAAVVAGVSATLAVVGMLLGTPGMGDGGFSTRGLLVALAGIAVLVLLRLAACGSAASSSSTRPYAR